MNPASSGAPAREVPPPLAIPNAVVAAMQPFGVEVTLPSASSLESLTPQALRGLAHEHKLAVVRGGATLSREALLRVCADDPERELLHWSFGPVMEMKVSPSPQNYLFTRQSVGFHCDGAFETSPSFLVFHCIQAPPAGAGGETLYCDTERLWEQADDARREEWRRIELTIETEKKAHYGGKVRLPLATRHPRRGTTVLRYIEAAEAVLNPMFVTIHGIAEDRRAPFVDEMKALIYSPRYCYQHRWMEGDLLIADNYALIHARNAFTEDCPRHLRRIQLL